MRLERHGFPVGKQWITGLRLCSVISSITVPREAPITLVDDENKSFRTQGVVQGNRYHGVGVTGQFANNPLWMRTALTACLCHQMPRLHPLANKCPHLPRVCSEQRCRWRCPRWGSNLYEEALNPSTPLCQTPSWKGSAVKVSWSSQQFIFIRFFFVACSFYLFVLQPLVRPAWFSVAQAWSVTCRQDMDQHKAPGIHLDISADHNALSLKHL